MKGNQMSWMPALNASAEHDRPIMVRNCDRSDQCLETLSDMGFAGADRLKSLAASGQKVGFKVYLDEIDRVLASSILKTHQRIQLKTMLDRHGFIKVRR
jgi:hypothetical protein